MKNVHHPNIIEFYDYYQTDKAHYIVMELWEYSLFDWLI